MITSSRAPEAVGPYPHARRVGDFIFVSGMGPRRRGAKEIPGVELDATGAVRAKDIEVQTHAVIENVRLVLEDAGATLEDVVDVSVFLTDMKNDFQKFNKVYGQYFQNATRTTVEVLSLPTPIAVELKVIAYKPVS